MRKRKQLNWFVSFYAQLAIIFPYLVAAPRFFGGGVGMGFLFQTASAFREVQGPLSWFIHAYPPFATWKAAVDRLTNFSPSLEPAPRQPRQLVGHSPQDHAA